MYIADLPPWITGTVQNAVSLQSLLDLLWAHTGKEIVVNASDDNGLSFVNDQVAIFVLRIAQKAIVVDLHLALFVSELNADPDVLGKGL